MKRLAWCATAALVACHGAHGRAFDEVRIQLPVDPAHLDPILSGDAVALHVTLGDVYEPLWDVAGNPVLARAHTWSADARELTLDLRDDVIWHDGKPFGPDDVVHTLKLVGPGGAATPLAAEFDDLDGVEAVGAHGVRVRFHGFRVGRELDLAHLAIVPAHLPAAAIDRAPVGTGPYHFESWTPAQAIRFGRFERYWGARPALRELVYRIIPDANQAMAQLRAGELDLLPQAPGTLVATIKPADALQVIPYDAPSVSTVIWNCRHPALADPRLRRALTEILDRATIIKEIYRGRARAISGPWEPGAPASDPAVAPWPYDPVGARSLLGEAGVPTVAVSILLPKDARGLEKVASIWQDDANRAGLQITVHAVPWDVLVARAQSGDFDGIMLSLSTAPEQDFFANLHSGGSLNYGGFADGQTDSLLEEIRTTADAPKRIALEHALHARLHELEPMTFISADVRVAVARARLQQVHLDADGVKVRDLTMR